MKMSNEKKINNLVKANRRNIMKKFMSLLIALFMILGLSTSIAKAEENNGYDYTYTGIEKWGNDIIVNGEKKATALFKIKNTDGILFQKTL